METRVFDVDGSEKNWAWLTGTYGRIERLRATGFPRFELVRIERTIGPANLKVKVQDDKGAPMGVLVAMTYPDPRNPWDQLPLFTGDPAKSMWSNRGALQFTDGMTGLTGFGLGGDSWIKDPAAGGPYHAWVYHNGIYSDCISWIGWKLFTDHDGPCSVTFQLVTSGGGPVDPPPVPGTGDLAEVVALLRETNALIKNGFRL
jgi:hypothetical protein